MRLLFVTDGRSATSQNWIRHFVERGDEVYLASTFACDVDFPVKRLEITPVAFSSTKKRDSRLGTAASRNLGPRTTVRQWLGPLTIPLSSRGLRAFIGKVKPDLVHAMRIPFEGMLAAQANIGPPLIVSVWGNDFTLHAPSAPLMKYYTRRTLSRTQALHVDCARDLRLAHELGFGVDKPTLMIPGNGGIRGDVFYPPREPVETHRVINPRGIRAYVRNDSFFKAIPIVLARHPEARFICSSMQGEWQALKWTKELQIEHAVQLDAPIPHAQMGGAFRSAQVVVSPSEHDGTPNSLLEGMACGCFPIAGDLESIREWITHGKNGLLVNPGDPQAIADAILLGFEREDLRREAAGLNMKLIATRAEYQHSMMRAGEFYESVIRDFA